MLIDIKSAIPDVVVDLKYATIDNFCKEVVYDFNICLSLEETAEQLVKVQEELKPMGLQIKIWDIYRPFDAQLKFWNIIQDPRYISDPRITGGRHTRGTSVDLTIIKDDGTELLMPSEFDEFTNRAHLDYTDGPKEALTNRQLLQDLMSKHGFVGLPTEWWHFDLKNWEEFPPLHINPSKATPP
ncbi:MAG: D-alanyl-D-alanine dipeptidase [Chlamydiia bacterium]|nr:D-alanyl-D-alanine dipeptidase [Chlamydiia bacterium]